MINIIILTLVLVGLVTFAIGMLINNLTVNIAGFLIVTVTLFYKLIKDMVRKEKSAFEYMENKDKSILPLPKATLKRRGVRISHIIAFVISVTVFMLAWNLMTEKTIFNPSSPLYLESVINKGCVEFRPNGCNSDPSKVTVEYDVNRDGIIGGVNDSLSGLLANYNCTGDCLKRRCSCPGY